MSVKKKEKEKEKDQKSTAKSQDRKGGGRGTHGSITKAGKVRNNTPKIQKTNLKKNGGPLQRNRKEYLRWFYGQKKQSTSGERESDEHI